MKVDQSALPMISADNISISYGKKRVLRGISFEANRGDVIGLVGTNGCGKTTLLKILAGIIKPDGGRLMYYGHETAGNPKLCRKMAGYVPQDNPLLEELSVRDNLKLWYSGRDALNESLQNGMLGVLGVGAYLDQRVSTLSGGMKKKVTIGIAMNAKQPVLLLDEPGAALDLPGRKELADYLKEYASKGGTVLMASHEESELALCNRILVMRDGVLSEVSPNLNGEALLERIR